MSSSTVSSIHAALPQQQFESIFSQPRFEGLKAIFEKLRVDRAALYASVIAADTYEQVLARLGYKLTLTRQIHVQDCYTRLGCPGGFKAVWPYHDIPSHSSFPTVVNFDGSLTTTEKGATFFGALLSELKQALK